MIDINIIRNDKEKVIKNLKNNSFILKLINISFYHGFSNND